VAVGNDGLWNKFCEALQWSDLLADKRFTYNKDRVANREVLEEIISGRFREMETDEIIDKLDEYGVPCGPIQNIEQVMTSPQVVARNMMVDIEHPNIPSLKVPAFPVKFSGTPIVVQSRPPLLGQHTEEVLTELGYSKEMIKNLTVLQKNSPSSIECRA